MIVPYTLFADTQWPAIPSPFAAGVLGVLFQLEHTQWMSPDTIRDQQLRQLKVVAEHAYTTVPFYRQRFDSVGLAPADAVDAWHQLPPLTRRDIQISGSQLHSGAPPQNHGVLRRTTTGGSTGQPVTVLMTELSEFFWRVFTLREHIWHRRDLSLPLAVIRYAPHDVGQPPMGTKADSWGTGATGVFPTGPAHLLNIKSTIHQQAVWLHQLNPGYVMGYPSALAAVARLFEERNWQLSRLQQVITFGEILEATCRSVCERAFGAKVADMYSSQEVGYIALQCPDCDCYHVQSENVFVEVVSEDGKPCQPGRVGRVLVSTLHNLAMPLLRYDIGDFAEVGEPCRCGRGLPTLKRILGRQRNLLVLPTGELRWPVFVSEDGTDNLPPFFQFQVVQRTLHELDINVVRPTPEVTPEEHQLVEAHFQRVLGYPFRVTINCVSEVPRSPTGKFEDFISLVHDAR